MNYGTLEDETCGRNNCEGSIKRHEIEGCSCHINPPCSACTEATHYCPVCDWEEDEELT